MGFGSMKLWDKGYGIDKRVSDFAVGNDYLLDRKLVRYDCIASIAHAKMLGKIGILNATEVRRLKASLSEIIKLDANGRFPITKADEDCHTAIENYLTRKLGSLGKKIHTARSRNDQVAVALRLYYKDELDTCIGLAGDFMAALRLFRRRYDDIRVPGYTHTRKAMPSSMGMWSGALLESMEDNLKIMKGVRALIDQSPLGTGAGYGIPLKIDRAFTAKQLGFSRIQRNPIYVQNSRGKFESIMVGSLSMVMFDLNKMAQDLIMFSMPEFGYFVIPRDISAGSSMMPQKQNPDALEILRANYHLVNSYDFTIRGIISNLPSGYNKDLQLTKGPAMESFEVVEQSLRVAATIMKRVKADRKRSEEGLTEEVYATERAYSLVKKGTPFRDAYRKAARELLQNERAARKKVTTRTA